MIPRASQEPARAYLIEWRRSPSGADGGPPDARNERMGTDMDASTPVIERPLEPRQAAIIVGASTGLGAGLARKLADVGYDLALFSRDLPRLQALADELRAGSDRKIFVYGHDVHDVEQVPTLLQEALRQLGRLDLFIYNAGIMYQQEPDRFQAEEDLETLQVNLLGAVAWIDPVAERFARAGHGHLVGVGSISGERGRRAIPAYSASKAGLHTYLEAMRNRLSRRGVTVTTLKPGQIQTAMLKKAEAVRGPISVERFSDLAWLAIRQKRQVAFIPPRWGLIALVIRNIPSFIFRRLNL